MWSSKNRTVGRLLEVAEHEATIKLSEAAAFPMTWFTNRERRIAPFPEAIIANSPSEERQQC
jgi:hypothetical protein